jgi:FecR protein
MHKLLTRARTAQTLLLAIAVAAFVPRLHAQSHEVATVIELEGQVSVIRGGQVPLFQKGTPGAPVDQISVRAKEEIWTGVDGHAVFQIRDGSTFEVFPNSRVTFQGQWTIEDMLQLVLGKIRVQIEHKNGPNHKKVTTPTAIISVRGTVFDVNVEDEDGTTFVSVEEGQVQVRHALLGGDAKILNQYDTVRVYANQPLAQAKGAGPAARYVWVALKNAGVDLVLNNPGGVIPANGGTIPTSGSGSGDKGKPTKNPPTTAPPANPGGGGN